MDWLPGLSNRISLEGEACDEPGTIRDRVNDRSMAIRMVISMDAGLSEFYRLNASVQRSGPGTPCGWSGGHRLSSCAGAGARPFEARLRLIATFLT